MNGARLLKRVFDFDLEHCPNCGGELKIITAILEQPVIEKMLSHLGLDPQPPPKSRAREAGQDCTAPSAPAVAAAARSTRSCHSSALTTAFRDGIFMGTLGDGGAEEYRLA